MFIFLCVSVSLWLSLVFQQPAKWVVNLKPKRGRSAAEGGGPFLKECSGGFPDGLCLDHPAMKFPRNEVQKHLT